MTTPVYEYTDLDKIKADFEIGMRQTAEETGMDSDEFASDLVEAFALQADTVTAYEFCRTELGWVPSGLRRMRPDVARYERRHPIDF